MSPKELLYIEDALNHETFLKCQFNDTAQKLSDTELKNFVTSMVKDHTDIFDNIFKTL